MKMLLVSFALVLFVSLSLMNCGEDKSTTPDIDDPTVVITSPADGEIFVSGDNIDFTGTGQDNEGAPLTGSMLVWTSDQDDTIGTGGSFSNDTLRAATHVVTLTGTDSGGRSGSASITIHVEPYDYQYYVDVNTGDDTNPGTTPEEPFKTITHAVSAAGPNGVIKVMPGTYSAATGETFPIQLQSGQTLAGDPNNYGMGATSTYIYGDGDTGYSGSYQYSTLMGAADALITGFLIGTTGAHSTVFYVQLRDNPATVKQCTFESGAYGGLQIVYAEGSVVDDCDFHTSSYGIISKTLSVQSSILNSRFHDEISIPVTCAGYTLIGGNTVYGSGQNGLQVNGGTATVINNSFINATGYSYGAIVATSEAEVYARGNSFECETAVLVRTNHTGTVDLGTGADPGGNDFSTVTGSAIVHYGNADIDAVGNTWSAATPERGRDVLIMSGGSVKYGSPAPDVLESQVEAYLTWKSASDNSDLTGNTNDSTPYNGAYIDIARNSNHRGYHFDGLDDYVQLANESNFDLSEFTITTIFMVEDLSEIRMLVAKDHSTHTNDNFCIRVLTDGSVQYSHHDWGTAHPNISIVPGEYYNLTIVVNSTSAVFYLDGNLEGSTVYPVPPGFNDNPVTLGRSPANDNQHLDGVIDVLRIYREAISASEVARAFEYDDFYGQY